MALRDELKNIGRETAKQGAEVLAQEAGKSLFAWLASIPGRIKARRARKRAEKAARK